MEKINYSNIVAMMLKAVPEIKSRFDEESAWWDEILPHIVFGDIFNPYLVNLLKENHEKVQIAKVFDFLEKMAACSDERVKEVLAVTILEQLGDEKTILERAREYMRKSTREISDDIEIGWGR